MNLSDLKSPFTIDGREGNRVGYWCKSCGKAIPVNEKEISWDFSGPLADGTHRVCGTLIESIWED